MPEQILVAAWISSGTIQMQGLALGGLNRTPGIEVACSEFQEVEKIHKDATLWAVFESGSGTCDWGCEYSTTAEKVT